MNSMIIQDFQELQRKTYPNATFRARLILVLPPNSTKTDDGVTFRVTVSDFSMSMQGTFRSWDEDTYHYLLMNIQEIIEFNGTRLDLIKEDGESTENFLEFSLDRRDLLGLGFVGRFHVIPNCRAPLLTVVVQMQVRTSDVQTSVITSASTLQLTSTPKLTPSLKRTSTATESTSDAMCSCMLPLAKYCHIDGRPHLCNLCGMSFIVPFCGATLPGRPPVRHSTLAQFPLPSAAPPFPHNFTLSHVAAHGTGLSWNCEMCNEPDHVEHSCTVWKQ